jgi:hypothetical protein
MERVNTPSPQQALRGIEAGGIGLQGSVNVTRSREVSAELTTAHSREPPSDVRTAPFGDLWMIDHNGKTVLRCRCLAVSATRMRLCVPAGYGVAVGQRYELGARRACEDPFSLLRAAVTVWVTVLQTQNMTDQDADRIDVAVAVDPIEATPIGALT